MVRVHQAVKRLEEAPELHEPAERLAATVSDLVPPGPLKDLLAGSWFGHALHPALTDLPLGTWMSATILDLLGGGAHDRASRVLIAVGLAASLPTAASGAVDWADTVEGDRRAGLAHAGLNVAASSLYAASLLARARGRRRFGVLLGLMGCTAAVAGSYVGGHLTLGKGVGVERTAFEHGPTEWTAVIDIDELPEAEARCVSADGVPVFVYRRGQEILALANTCGHLGGPLHEGRVEGDTVECPWHGTIYGITDGALVRGPARAPQPRYETRISDGNVEVRLAD